MALLRALEPHLPTLLPLFAVMLLSFATAVVAIVADD